jgi:competence protein ComEC
LDLRDGAAVFVNVPGERNDCLIDGGSDWSGERVVVPFLRAQGVDRLGAIVLTRGDKAHAAGLGAVMRQMPVARAIHSGTGSRSRFFWEWLEAARRRQLEIMTAGAGDWLDLGAAVRGRVLSPSLVARSDRSDDNALVLLLDSGGTRVLLMSDVGETVERRLLSSGVDLRAQVIIKGRHGEETSCSDAFLDAVRPELVVQSVGTRPSERYLQPDLRDRLQQRGIRLFRTDETGAVTIRLVPSGFTIRTWLADGTASQ